MPLLAGQVLLIDPQQLLDGDQYGLAYVSQLLGHGTLMSFTHSQTDVLSWSSHGLS